MPTQQELARKACVDMLRIAAVMVPPPRCDLDGGWAMGFRRSDLDAAVRQLVAEGAAQITTDPLGGITGIAPAAGLRDLVE